MGKLLDNLNRQLKTEFKEDAEDCLKIYNYLKDNGGVWSSRWNPLTTVTFVGKYPNYKRIYKPNYIGKIFIKNIEYEKR